MLHRLLIAILLALLAAPVHADDVMPMPYRVGKGYPDPTRPGVTVPSLAQYVRQLYASKDERARMLADGLCRESYTEGGKSNVDAPIVDFWQENKDQVVLLLVKREYRLQCDWTDRPDTREIDPAASGLLCKPKRKKTATPDAAPPFRWHCRTCPPGGCAPP